MSRSNRKLIREVLGLAALCSMPGLIACRTAPTPSAVTAKAAAVDSPRSGSLDWVTTSGVLHVRVLAPGVVRVVLMRGADKRVPESFAVTPDRQTTSAPYRVEEHEGVIVVRTAKLGLRIVKQPLSVALLDPSGAVISEQAAPMAWGEPGWSATWRLHPDEQVYGLGDKVRGFDRRGQQFELWNSDAYGWKPDADPLYKSIPFVVLLNQGRASGLFIDTPARAQVDVGKTVSDVFRLSRSGGRRRLLPVRGPEPEGNRRGVHGAHRANAAAAALGARLSPKPLQLHDRTRRTRRGHALARRQDPERRAVARHRLSARQRAVHGQRQRGPRGQTTARKNS
jgi:hypothetical protein